MNSMLLPLLTALVIGLLVGVLSMWDGAVEPAREAETATPEASQQPLTEQRPSGDQAQRMRALEQQVLQLNQRLAELEETLAQSDATESTALSSAASEDNNEDADPLNQDNLVQAGVSTELASEIMRRLGEQEYQRLALRDRAIREGYFRSGRYFRELRELRSNQLSLRNEIGDQAYDRYLYQTGQNNRVAVSSVMAGSPADQIGIQQGDILLRYNNSNIFSWNEIRQATSQGELGEYVTVDVMRDGQMVSLMLPRGPMGVKLDSTRLPPGNSP